MNSDTATHPETDERWKTALAAFETSLATPIISGELADWLSAVRKSWEEASAQIHDQLKERHRAQYDEISQADPELLPRVEQLQVEDEAIEAELESLNSLVNRTTEHAPKLEPDEEKAARHTKKLVDAGMAFVARVRKQEVAIQTWFIEAFNRDRGAVD